MTGAPSDEDVAVYLRALEGGLADLIFLEHVRGDVYRTSAHEEQVRAWRARHEEFATRVTGSEAFLGWFASEDAQDRFWKPYVNIHPTMDRQKLLRRS